MTKSKWRQLKKCEWCGEEFLPVSPKQKCCSIPCQIHYKEMKIQEKAEKDKKIREVKRYV